MVPSDRASDSARKALGPADANARNPAAIQSSVVSRCRAIPQPYGSVLTHTTQSTIRFRMESKRHPQKNSFYLAAAGLMALTTLVHLFAGGPEIYAPLRDATLAPVVVSTLSVVWHMISLLLGLYTVALFWLWQRSNDHLAVFICAGQIAFALLFVTYGIADFGSVLPLPQWTIFALTAAFIGLGLRKSR